MAHPIHLHGHYFRVLGSLANSTFPANMTIAQVLQDMPDSVIGQALDGSSASPRRDSVHLPEGGWLAIRFLADNPGAWLLHCHINSHLAVSLHLAERVDHSKF
jgi:FtsP/CotA-like multicopper oxidase with cupredoxin domain